MAAIVMGAPAATVTIGSGGAGTRLRPLLIALALVVLASPILVRDLVRLPESWPYVAGWEYEWAAESIAAGRGFSLAGEHRRLISAAERADPAAAGRTEPTAWVEPAYPYALAAAFRLFGERGGRAAMVTLQAACLLATLAVVYRTGRRLAGAAAGWGAVGALALVAPAVAISIGALINSAPAALAAMLCALLGLCLVERPSVGRGFAAGAAAGAGALVHAALLALVPALALAALVFAAPGHGGPLRSRAWLPAAAVALAAALAVAPWAARNHAAFGELIPGRTGGGFILYVGTRTLAETYGAAPPVDARRAPPWTAAGPVEAWRLTRDDGRRVAMEIYAFESALADLPRGFEAGSEAQRDRAFLRRALDFASERPATVAGLTVIKATSFFLHGSGGFSLSRGGVLTLLALVGLWRLRRDPRAWTLALMIAAYAAPYALTAPYFSRYRFPVEPLIAALAGVAVAALVRAASGRTRAALPPQGQA